MNDFFKSFGYAAQGIRVAFSGRNFKVQCAFAVLAVVLGFLFAITSVEWCAIIICIGIVLGLETLNTALEILCDRINPDFDPLISKTKDCAAGAVLIASLASLVVACILFLPRIWALLF